MVRNSAYTFLQQNRARELGTEFNEEIHSEPAAKGRVAETPEVLVMRSAEQRHLNQAVESLPVEFREVFVLRATFQGKLDYSVAVMDWAEQGYPLAGGRLDYVEDTAAAALVYRRAQHVVNLFVWPSKRIGNEPLQHLSRRGYSAYCWAKDGMHYWAVSDLNEAELLKFVELVRRQG